MADEIVLGIDTSGPRLQLCLAGPSFCELMVRDQKTGHAEIIFDEIAALLATRSLTYDDLTRIAVTTGPGSFTGLRIGLSAARGLGLALNVPVTGVPTLLALSLGQTTDQPFRIFVDARRDEAYVQDFKAPGIAVRPAMLLPLDAARTSDGLGLIEPAAVDIAAMTAFAADADPDEYPPQPDYLRGADAKPQTRGRIALQDTAQ